MSEKNCKYIIKYIMIGNASVGKSCILNSFLTQIFSSDYKVTVGVEFGTKAIKIKDKKLKLQIWDTSGQENFKSITRSYFRSAAVAFIIFDITSKRSFLDAEKWISEIEEFGNKTVTLVLIGNKSDLKDKREIGFEECRSFAKSKNMRYFETSAKNGNFVEEIFYQSAEVVLEKIKDKVIDAESGFYGVKVCEKFREKGFFDGGLSRVGEKKKYCC